MQLKSKDAEIGSDIESGISAVKGAGQPLPEPARNLFDSRFGADFNHVRIHTDTQAEETTRSINARAFTLGRNIVFGQGQYSLGTTEGKSLLAHELTHVLQQRITNSVQRKAAIEGSQNGAATKVDLGRQSPIKESDCSGWQRDPQSISKVAAEHYVVMELGLFSRITAGLVKSIKCDTSPLCCREPGGIADCFVEFPNGLQIHVTIYLDKIQVSGPKSPICLYDYTCPPSGELVLRKRKCF